MNEIMMPDLSGSNSEKILELFRYIEELRMESSAEITSLRRRLESVTNILKGGEAK